MATKTSNNTVENLLDQTNDLLRKQLILQLALMGTPHQTIRQMVKCDMKYITNLLKPLKGKIAAK